VATSATATPSTCNGTRRGEGGGWL
jgi:hypothetical protein